jgi:AcrR family transcriptional regulator
MTGKRAEKRDGLRQRLIEAAESRLAAGGLAELRARDITADAGCALGGLYNAFADLNMLILEVNARTLRRLDAQMTEALKSAQGPGEAMHILSRVYLAFARREPRLWWALFQFQMPEGSTVPDWYAQEQAMLLAQIVRPLAQLQPGLSEGQLIIRARTLYGAVHGIVSISLENRFVGVPGDTLDAELERFIDLLLAGLPTMRGS